MNPRVYSLFFVSVATYCLFQLTACTAIGYSIGSSIDDSNVSTDTIRAPQLMGLKPGTGVRVITKDGVDHIGTYLGMDFTSPAEYQKQFNNWHDSCQNCQLLPLIGDSVTLTLNTHEHGKIVGEILSFTPTSVEVRQRLIDRIPEGSVVQIFDLEDIDSLGNKNGWSIAASALHNALSDGNIPTRRSLSLWIRNDTIHFPTFRVEKVITEPRSPATGRTVGTVIGLGIDLAIVAVTILPLAFITTNK